MAGGRESRERKKEKEKEEEEEEDYGHGFVVGIYPCHNPCGVRDPWLCSDDL